MFKKLFTKKSEEKYYVPKEVINVSSKLKSAGYQAYLIGGCVRDILLNRKPKDWDLTTDATPEQIISLFPKTFYENTFGTVGVVDENCTDDTVKVIEVTPFRLESEYSDNRRPDSVIFSQKLDDDLQRRDFTINAIALNVDEKSGETNTPSLGSFGEARYSGEMIDPYKGQLDLAEKILKTVGNPTERFQEDGLRIMRAVRIATELGFTINEDTMEAITKNASLLKNIAKERIATEFNSLLMSKQPMVGIFMCQKLGLLPYIIPELEKTMGIEQGGAHLFDVYEHSLRSLQVAADKDFPLEIRLAALLHDIGKPKSRRAGTGNKEWTFFGHEVVGYKLAKNILEDLKYPKKISEKVLSLIRWHMFFSDTEQITLSAVRRMIVNVGQENIWDLMNTRICDRLGMGRPKEDPYRLRKYHSMIEEALRDPISVGMLKIDGVGLMKLTSETPGPRIGWILNAILEEILENPALNTVAELEKLALNKAKLTDKELREIGEKGKERKEEEEEKEIKKIRTKHKVK
jgi:poly(A) polymerase/tRNA nucleotidyltransferase (CCA-adding enzyme)